MRKLRTIKGHAGEDVFALIAPDYVDSVSLAAGVAKSFTVPANGHFAIFSATNDFYANYTTTATVPGDVSNGTASELNPTLRYIKGVTTISVIAPASAVVTITYYA